MKQVVKAILAATALPFVSVPLALSGPTSAAAALLPEGPATVLHQGPTPWAMPDYLQGAVCDGPKECEEVLYWWIISTPEIEIGVNENLFNLDYAIRHTTGPKVVYAFSGGARISTAWLTERAHDSDVPADELSFVLLGNGTRKYGGLSTWVLGDAITAPDTQYAVIDVAREYDPIADFPTNPFNLLAMANALFAFNIVHMDYTDVDVDDPDNFVWAEGNTTYVFVPTENLPLLQPLRNLGLDQLADQLEVTLRPLIDAAYDRSYLPASPQGVDAATLTSDTSDSARTAITSLTASDDEAEIEESSDAKSEAPPVQAVPGEDVGETSEGEDEVSAEAPEIEVAPEPEEESTPATPDTAVTDEVADTEAETETAAADETAEQTEEAEPVKEAERTGPRHRAPLNGTKKATVADEPASESDADRTDKAAGTESAPDSDSKADSDSPS